MRAPSEQDTGDGAEDDVVEPLRQAREGTDRGVAPAGHLQVERRDEQARGAAAREAEPGASLFTSQQSSVSPTNTKPDHNKTTAQSLGDKMGRTKDNEVHGSTGESVGDKVKGALGMGKH